MSTSSGDDHTKPNRDTPEWQRYYDHHRAKFRPSVSTPDTPEWRAEWHAIATEQADADYALLQGLRAFERHVVAEATAEVRAAPSPSTAKPPSTAKLLDAFLARSDIPRGYKRRWQLWHTEGNPPLPRKMFEPKK